MCPLMYLQVFTPSENFAASRKRTRKRFLPRVHPDMIDQFVFRFERSSIPRTILPKTRVCRTFRASDVFHRQMRHNLLHGVKMFAARFPGRCLIRVYPKTLHFLLDWLPHIPKESPMYVSRMMRHRHVMIEVLMVVCGGVIGSMRIRSRIQHLMVRC